MAAEGQVIACHAVDDWKLQFDKAKDSGKLVVVDFTASWCGPCKFISPILAELAKKMTDIIVLKVDVDELKTVSEEYDIEAMPTFIFFREGKVIDRFVGAKKDELLQSIKTHTNASSATSC